MRKHAMPNTYALYLLGSAVGIFVLTIYMFLIASNKELWWDVIETIRVSPYILGFGVGMFCYAIMLTLVGITIYIKKDRQTE